MFIMRYGSFAYILALVVLVGILVGLTFLLRNKSERTKKIIFYTLVFFNLFQHLFKGIVWPHIPYRGFELQNSAYNMCALLIIAIPIAYLLNNSLWKDFVTYFGINGGLIAMLVPYWFIDKSIITFDYLRFYVCHSLLFITAFLPVTIGLHKINFKHFWKVGFLFFLSLGLIILNDMIFIVARKTGNIKDLYASLYALNPTWSFHPTDVFTIIEPIIAFFSPKCFMNSETNYYLPILWYAIPLYLLITALAFLFTAIFDKKNFLEFCCKVKSFILLVINKTKKLFKKNKEEIK